MNALLILKGDESHPFLYHNEHDYEWWHLRDLSGADRAAHIIIEIYE